MVYVLIPDFIENVTLSGELSFKVPPSTEPGIWNIKKAILGKGRLKKVYFDVHILFPFIWLSLAEHRKFQMPKIVNKQNDTCNFDKFILYYDVKSD